MLSGVKFISRDEIDKDEKSDATNKKKSKKSVQREKHRSKNKSSRYSSSDEDLDRIKKGPRKKKWYSSEEYSSASSHSSESEDNSSSYDGEKGHRSRKNSKKKRSKSGQEKNMGKKSKEREIRGDCDLSDGDGETNSSKDMEIMRKEIGLEWMLRPAKAESRPTMPVENEPEKVLTDEIKVNPRELNPYLKDNGSGYPEDNDETRVGGDRPRSSSVVGDGGASWRLKALKRAKEQAAREGRSLDEVVEERWGSLGQLTVSVASQKAAPSRAHLHAIKSRKRDVTEDPQAGSEAPSENDIEKRTPREYLRDVSIQRPQMREPRVQDSLSWGKRKGQNTFAKDDASLVSEALSNLNKFQNDGSFMSQFLHEENSVGGPIGDKNLDLVSSERDKSGVTNAEVKEASSANQLAARAFQLRLKGKHEEADKLMQEVESLKAKQGSDHITKQRTEESSSRYVLQDKSLRHKKNEDDADMHLAQKIVQNKRYNTYGQADDEYDYDDGPATKSRKKRRGDENRVARKNTLGNHLLTQQERCVFCFENTKRPAHLVVAIANFSYLMLPQWEPVVPGHCCILPMQHVPSTRTVDDDVWDEIRNFKKCLIMMFAEQEKDVIFLETVMDLAKQQRHCLVECIPLPRDIAKEAPLYFKKAIDEAEDEWSQHNAKKLIDTSVKGLRASIPKHFPYFHVEFGLYKGFVHVIDDEKQFKSSLGLNVIRGMLQLPEEDMHRRRRYETVEAQKQAVKSFARDWAPFDWTKQLNQ